MERRIPILRHTRIPAHPNEWLSTLCPLSSHQHWGKYRASLAVALPPLSARRQPSIIFPSAAHFVHAFQSISSIYLPSYLGYDLDHIRSKQLVRLFLASIPIRLRFPYRSTYSLYPSTLSPPLARDPSRLLGAASLLSDGEPAHPLAALSARPPRLGDPTYSVGGKAAVTMMSTPGSCVLCRLTFLAGAWTEANVDSGNPTMPCPGRAK